jgi:hypothetical protein
MPPGKSQSNVYNAGSNYVPMSEMSEMFSGSGDPFSKQSQIKRNFSHPTQTERMIVRGVDDPREIVTDEEYVPSIQYDEISGSGNTYGSDPGYRYGPFHDLDPDFISSRERMGACKGSLDGGRSRCSTFTSIDTESLGVRNDDILDGERCAAMGLRPCVENTPRSALKLMYNDVMGLPNQRPSEEDCEFKSTNGYTYKDRCDM